jgi:hypothetical protein
MVPLHPPKIPHELAWDWTWPSTVKGNTLWSYRWLPTLQGNMLPPSWDQSEVHVQNDNLTMSEPAKNTKVFGCPGWMPRCFKNKDRCSWQKKKYPS